MSERFLELELEHARGQRDNYWEQICDLMKVRDRLRSQLAAVERDRDALREQLAAVCPHHEGACDRCEEALTNPDAPIPYRLAPVVAPVEIVRLGDRVETFNLVDGHVRHAPTAVVGVGRPRERRPAPPRTPPGRHPEERDAPAS